MDEEETVMPGGEFLEKKVGRGETEKENAMHME